MLRRLKWILVLLVVVLVAGAGIAVLTTKPGPRATPVTRSTAAGSSSGRTLVHRYAALAGVEQALVAAGGPDRAVTRDLRAELARWKA